MISLACQSNVHVLIDDNGLENHESARDVVEMKVEEYCVIVVFPEGKSLWTVLCRQTLKRLDLVEVLERRFLVRLNISDCWSTTRKRGHRESRWRSLLTGRMYCRYWTQTFNQIGSLRPAGE